MYFLVKMVNKEQTLKINRTKVSITLNTAKKAVFTNQSTRNISLIIR